MESSCVLAPTPSDDLSLQSCRIAQQLRTHLSAIRTNDPVNPNKFKGLDIIPQFVSLVSYGSSFKKFSLLVSYCLF